MDERNPPAVTILLVDDDPDMRVYLKRCLRKLPCEIELVLEASDGVEALAQTRRGGVDLIISDVVMPRMDGFALCEKVREEEGSRDVPLLLITGEISIREIRERGGWTQAVEILNKPFNAQKLCTTVMRILDALPPT